LRGTTIGSVPATAASFGTKKIVFWLLYHAYSAGSFILYGREWLAGQVLFEQWLADDSMKAKGPSINSPLLTGSPKRRAKSHSSTISEPTLRPGWEWPQEQQTRLSTRLQPETNGRPGTDQRLRCRHAGSLLRFRQYTADYYKFAKLKPGTAAGLAAVR